LWSEVLKTKVCFFDVTAEIVKGEEREKKREKLQATILVFSVASVQVSIIVIYDNRSERRPFL